MAMKNRVSITICDKEYILITEENDEYVKSLAKYIEKMIEDSIYKNVRSTKTDAAILTCLDLCDQRNKLQEANDNMRKQISEYVDEVARLNKKLTKYERQKTKTSGGDPVEENVSLEGKENQAAL